MNPRLAAIAPSLIRDLHARRRPSTIDLGLGEPTLSPPEGPLRAAFDWVARHGCRYSPNAGLDPLREAIAAHHAYPGLSTAASVGVTVGSQEALAVAVAALLDPTSDEALVVGPAYPLYAKLCDLFGVAVRRVGLDPADGFLPRAAPVLAALGPRTRVVFLASPANPTGRVWSRDELAALADGLTARPGPPVTLVFDEVYRELYFGDAAPPSAASFWGHTVVVGSLSKSCALTGLRVGWFLAHTDVAPALHKAHQFLVSCTSTLGQRAALEIFAQPALLGAHRPAYAARRAVLVESLRAAGLEHVEPDGAFYCMVRCQGPGAGDSLAWALALLAARDVLVIPGVAFGAEGWVRLSFAGDPATIREGVGRLAAFTKEAS